MLVFACAFPAFANDPVSYVNRTADANGNVTESETTFTSYTVVASDSTSWSSGWYVVNETLTISSRITVNGTVNLILCDGASLTVNGGVNVASDNSLTIYGQTEDTGTLTIASMDLEVEVPDPDDDEETITEWPYEYLAGIGGGNSGAGGTITINGGTINTTGGDSAAGIGGGYGGAGGTTTINGGTVNATGGDSGAGIGGGSGGAGGTITLSYTSDTDSITASSYNGTVTISDGKKFTDNTNEYSGSVVDVSVLAGKTLTPYVYTLTLGENITADFPKPGVGTTVTLSPAAGYEAAFSVNDEDISGNTFTMPSANVEVTATLTLITYTITYDLGGETLPDGRNNPETYTIESDTFNLPTLTKKYYTFAGWTGEGITEATATVTVKKGSTGNRTYSANWTQHGFKPADENTPEFAAYSIFSEELSA